MNRFSVLIAALALLPAAVWSATFEFSQFGGKGDGKSDNREAFVKAFEALKANPGSTLKIGPGVYRVATGAEKFVHERYHIIVRNLKDATIEGENARIVFTDPEHGGILFYLSPNLKLKSLEFDWDPVAFTQGEIVSVDPDNPRSFTYKIEPGFPDADNKNFKNYAPEGKFMIGFVYDPVTRKLFTARLNDNHKAVERVEKIDEHLFRITLKEVSSPDGVEAGRLFVLISRNPSNGIVFHACVKPEIRDVTMFSSSHIGMVFRFGTEQPHLENVQIRILPDSRRMISVNADSLFFDGCTAPVVRNCHLEGGMDDGIVLPVHGRPVVGKVDDSTYLVRCTWAVPFFGSNSLEAIDPKSGKRSGKLPVIAKLENERVEVIDGKRYHLETLRLSAPTTALKVGDQLFNRSFSNQNFVVENCVIENLRGKGVKIHGSGGVVRNCRIDGTTFGGIEIGYQFPGGDWCWMWAENIRIENNTILNAANLGLIQLTRIGWANGIRIHQGPDNFTDRPNRNITISGNTIDRCGQTAIRCWASENVTVVGNRIGAYNLMDFPSDTMPIDFINVTGVVEKDNVIGNIE